MLKNLVGGSPRSERAGKSPRAAARKLRAVVESLEGRTMMSVALMSVAVSGVADRLIPIPAEVTTVTSSRVASNLASPAPLTAIPLGFDKALVTEIKKLENTTNDISVRKAQLLQKALTTFEKLLGPNYTSKMTASRLTDESVYAFTNITSPPRYFDAHFRNNTISVMTKPGRYDYSTATSTQYWVDFANHILGGGVFGTGFLQEETMFLETPELANAAAQFAVTGQPLTTRTGTKDTGPLDGNPTPLIFEGANVVMHIDSKWMVALPHGSKDRADENWRKQPPNTVLDHDMPLLKAKSINVLSMAAPYLPNPDPKDQTAPAVVDDLFNTFDAGFELAKTAGGKTIDTGPIGAGGFHNSPVVVYVMQTLAAKQVGVNLNFWGFSLLKKDTQKNQGYPRPDQQSGHIDHDDLRSAEVR